MQYQLVTPLIWVNKFKKGQRPKGETIWQISESKETREVKIVKSSVEKSLMRSASKRALALRISDETVLTVWLVCGVNHYGKFVILFGWGISSSFKRHFDY